MTKKDDTLHRRWFARTEAGGEFKSVNEDDPYLGMLQAVIRGDGNGDGPQTLNEAAILTGIPRETLLKAFAEPYPEPQAKAEASHHKKKKG